ncbi:beta-microseminoprotein-like [Apteryx mantelli]|uniref:Beta-microseminoprotein-like n=1 Tax=Apteryx mantelli TaxID=2696672 RepID=A0A8B7JWB8_9AVES|nr:PREDICTED: beta-microseminoprotein-like [Apteryx mantelli mantelli]
MKTFLACLLVLAISVTLSNASCFVEELKRESDKEVPGCTDFEGKFHEFGSQWETKNCMDCSCSRQGIGCCTSYATPINFDEEKCEAIFNKLTCSYKVVEKDDHTKECPVFEWVG